MYRNVACTYMLVLCARSVRKRQKRILDPLRLGVAGSHEPCIGAVYQTLVLCKNSFALEYLAVASDLQLYP